MATRTRHTKIGQESLLGDAAPSQTLEEIECEHLADWMERNGCTRPTITKAWLDAARRMRDIDGRTHDQIMKAIDWCQRSEFWQANIHSMPKLRMQYEKLRQQAIRDAKMQQRTPARTQRQLASDVRRQIALGQA